MSLINDALNKADEEAQQKNNDADKIRANSIPQYRSEENNIGSSKRTLILALLLAMALLFLGYRYLYPIFMDPNSGQENQVKAPTKPEEQAKLKAQKAQEKELQKLLKRARKSFKSGHLEYSLKLFQEALIKQPDNYEALNDIGMVYRKKENYEEAKKYYELALARNAQCAECFNNLGVVLTALNNDVQAIGNFKKAMKLKEDYSAPHLNYAKLLQKQKKYPQAIKEYQEFLNKADSLSSSDHDLIQGHIEELKRK